MFAFGGSAPIPSTLSVCRRAKAFQSFSFVLPARRREVFAGHLRHMRDVDVAMLELPSITCTPFRANDAVVARFHECTCGHRARGDTFTNNPMATRWRPTGSLRRTYSACKPSAEFETNWETPQNRCSRYFIWRSFWSGWWDSNPRRGRSKYNVFRSLRHVVATDFLETSWKQRVLANSTPNSDISTMSRYPAAAHKFATHAIRRSREAAGCHHAQHLDPKRNRYSQQGSAELAPRPARVICRGYFSRALLGRTMSSCSL